MIKVQAGNHELKGAVEGFQDLGTNPMGGLMALDLVDVKGAFVEKLGKFAEAEGAAILAHSDGGVPEINESHKRWLEFKPIWEEMANAEVEIEIEPFEVKRSFIAGLESVKPETVAMLKRFGFLVADKKEEHKKAAKPRRKAGK